MADLLTAQEVAAQWKCSPEHVQRLAKRGELAGMRLGGRPWRFTPEAVARFEAEHAAGQQPAETVVSLTPATHPKLLPLPAGYEPVCPELWGMQANTAASPAAGRTRGAGKKKAASTCQ